MATAKTVGGVSQAYVDGQIAAVNAALANKVDNLAPYSISGSNTLTQAAHFNRHGDWTGSSTGAQALPPSTTVGDFVELANSGSVRFTVTGLASRPGYKSSAEPGETFQAVYTSAGVWISLLPFRQDMIPLTPISANYSTVIEDVGVYHNPADASARTVTVPVNASVPYPVFKTLTFLNPNGAGIMTITAGDTVRLVGSGATGSRTLAPNGLAVMIWHGVEWVISGTGLT